MTEGFLFPLWRHCSPSPEGKQTSLRAASVPGPSMIIQRWDVNLLCSVNTALKPILNRHGFKWDVGKTLFVTVAWSSQPLFGKQLAIVTMSAAGIELTQIAKNKIDFAIDYRGMAYSVKKDCTLRNRWLCNIIYAPLFLSFFDNRVLAAFLTSIFFSKCLLL